METEVPRGFARLGAGAALCPWWAAGEARSQRL